ncbi:MAG: hypothetical protein NT141_02955 [candidate division WWE3 bacterium]|nr:hypothetical protein [candidate division WWE3 bacterium]
MFSINVESFAKNPYHYLNHVKLPMAVTVHGKPSYYVMPITKVAKSRDGLRFLKELGRHDSKKVAGGESTRYSPATICPDHNTYRAACGCGLFVG